jgi:predicted RNase H-like HicB family nuclease
LYVTILSIRLNKYRVKIVAKSPTDSKQKVLVYPGKDGCFVVEVPSLPGCVSQGKTHQEALVNVEDAIALYIKILHDRGESIPLDLIDVAGFIAALRDNNETTPTTFMLGQQDCEVGKSGLKDWLQPKQNIKQTATMSKYAGSIEFSDDEFSAMLQALKNEFFG